MTTGDEVRKHLSFERSEPGLIAYELKDYANGDSWKNILVIYNANVESVDYTLNDNWVLAVKGDAFTLENGEKVSGSIKIPPVSMLIAYQD